LCVLVAVQWNGDDWSEQRVSVGGARGVPPGTGVRSRAAFVESVRVAFIRGRHSVILRRNFVVFTSLRLGLPFLMTL
jgi:hypothetical protein